MTCWEQSGRMGRHFGRTLGLCCLAAVSLAGTVAGAQTLRDPTQPPPTVAANGLNESGRPAAVQSGSVAVVVRQGVPHLVVGTRLYAKGQKVGLARIERITETEVWLREDGILRKIQVFGGVERSASATTNAVLYSGQATRAVTLPKP